jgi:uncharacterized Zn-binding protein involved in type VI secretion
MGKSIQRVGDASSGGGIAIGAGHNNVLINGRPALRPRGPFTPHMGCGFRKPLHCFGLAGVGGGATTVRANGQPLVLTGDKDTCNHKRAGGSANVKAV